MFLIVAAVVVIFWLIQCIYTVQPDERGVELRFGKPKEEVSLPGLHFHLWPMDQVQIVKVTMQQQNIGGTTSSSSSGLMLSGDQNIINVQFSVFFTVSDPKAYLFNVENPAETLQQVAESAMREVVGRRPAQDAFRKERQAIETEVKQIVQNTMDNYKVGVLISAVTIQAVAPPREVADAFEEVQRADQDKDRLIEESNQYTNQKLGQARGQAAQLREEGAAYKDRVVKDADGDSQRFLSVYNEYVKAPQVTRERIFLETMESVLKNSNKVLLDGKQGVVPYLPLNDLPKGTVPPLNQAQEVK